MAKSTKPKAATTKKAKEVKTEIKIPEIPVEETVKVGALSENPENSEATIIDMPKSEAISKGLIQETPPSVTLDEVNEAKEVPESTHTFAPEPKVPKEFIVEETKEKQTVELFVPEIEKAIDQIKESYEVSVEQKIVNFIESRSGEIKMNDFLKSLYGVPRFNEPPVWLSQRASKELRATLSKLSNDGTINIVSNSHMKLGTFYYPDMNTGKTEYHNLNTVSIIAIK